MLPFRALLLSLLLTTGAASASVPAGLKVSGQGEVLYLGLIKVYDATLSVSNNANRANVLAADVSRCLKLDYVVELSADKFELAANTILERQHDAATLERFQPQISKLHGSYQAVSKGDHYQMCYDAHNQTTSLLLNGNNLVSIPSAEFAELYFGIWLGDTKPVSLALREDLLKGLQ